MAADMDLDEIAAKELLNEAKRGAARASVYGALGWQKCPLKPTNKIFLQNMLLSAISSNRQKVTERSAQNHTSKRKQDDTELNVCVAKKPTYCDKKSDSHDKRISSGQCNNKPSSITSTKCNIKRNSQEKKDSIHPSKPHNLVKRHIVNIKPELLKNTRDSNSSARKDCNKA